MDNMKTIEKARIFAKELALEELIGRFNLRRIELNNRLGKEEKDTDRIAELDKEIKSIYDEVMQNENMRAYNTAKAEVDQLMAFINAILSAGVNGENPDEVDESACTGNCASCGGCH